MKKNVLLIVCLCFFTGSIYTQSLGLISFDSDTKDHFQLSLIYPLGTSGPASVYKSYELSLNLFLGFTGAINGFEAGGFVNLVNTNVNGVQLAGFGNIVGVSCNGVQMAGFGNVNGKDLNGVQLAGFGNFNGGTVSGVQGAGFANINGCSEKLVQVAGFANVTTGNCIFQGSGFINIADDIVQATDSFENIEVKVPGGAQLAGFANVSKNINGLQAAGFINIAQNVKGLQLAGFLNYCDSIEGIPIAFLSIVKKNGYRKLTVSSNETFYVNTSFKIGVEKFYTIINLGYRPGINLFNWATGVGFGSMFNIDEKRSIDISILHHTIINDEWFRDGDINSGYHSLNQLGVCFKYKIDKRLSVYAGPTYNVLVSENDSRSINLAPSWAWNLYDGNFTTVKTWFGFNAGFEF